LGPSIFFFPYFPSYHRMADSAFLLDADLALVSREMTPFPDFHNPFSDSSPFPSIRSLVESFSLCVGAADCFSHLRVASPFSHYFVFLPLEYLAFWFLSPCGTSGCLSYTCAPELVRKPLRLYHEFSRTPPPILFRWISFFSLKATIPPPLREQCACFSSVPGFFLPPVRVAVLSDQLENKILLPSPPRAQLFPFTGFFDR